MRPQKSSVLLAAIPAFVLACAALTMLASLLSRLFAARLGHDQISYLFEAQRLLSGAQPYGPHLSETNPPLIIWFSTLPVAAANLLHGSPILFFKLLVLAMVVASVAWCVRLLRLNPTLRNYVAISLLGCAIFWIECRIGEYDFGQREHLLIILLLPYLLAGATGAVSRLSLTERAALGLTAGLAIWFKPQDTLIVVALELFLALRARSLRRALAPEFLALVLTSSILLALVRLLTPLYFTSTFPLLQDTYWALGTTDTLTLALSLRHYMALAFLILLACLLLRRSLRDPAVPLAVLAAGVGASFAFDIQHTGWPYHRYPHQALLLLALCYLFTDLLYPAIVSFTSKPRLLRNAIFVAAAAAAVLLCAIAIHPHLAHLDPEPAPPEDAALDSLLDQLQPRASVYIFSTSVLPLATVYSHGLNWGSRFAHLWMMPAIIQNELGPTGPPAPFKRLPPATLTRLAALQRAQSNEDLNFWHPSVVLIEHCTLSKSCQGIEGKTFDMISWFLQSREFAATWSHYQRQAPLKDYDVYKLVP